MEHNRLGLMGHYYSGMLDVYSDLTQQCATFGGHIELIEVDELPALRETVTFSEIEQCALEFYDAFDVQSDCPTEELHRAARTSLALLVSVEGKNMFRTAALALLLVPSAFPQRNRSSLGQSESGLRPVTSIAAQPVIVSRRKAHRISVTRTAITKYIDVLEQPLNRCRDWEPFSPQTFRSIAAQPARKAAQVSSLELWETTPFSASTPRPQQFHLPCCSTSGS